MNIEQLKETLVHAQMTGDYTNLGELQPFFVPYQDIWDEDQIYSGESDHDDLSVALHCQGVLKQSAGEARGIQAIAVSIQGAGGVQNLTREQMWDIIATEFQEHMAAYEALREKAHTTGHKAAANVSFKLAGLI